MQILNKAIILIIICAASHLTQAENGILITAVAPGSHEILLDMNCAKQCGVRVKELRGIDSPLKPLFIVAIVILEYFFPQVFMNENSSLGIEVTCVKSFMKSLWNGLPNTVDNATCEHMWNPLLTIGVVLIAGLYILLVTLIRITKRIIFTVKKKKNSRIQHLYNAAMGCLAIRDYAKAETLYREAIDIEEKTLGKNHPDVAWGLSQLTQLYYIQGNHNQAEPLLQRILEITKDLKMLFVASIFRRLELRFQAQSFFQRAINTLKSNPSVSSVIRRMVTKICFIFNNSYPFHDYMDLTNQELSDIAINIDNLASFYQAQGKYTLATSLYEHARVIFKRLSEDSNSTQITSTLNWFKRSVQTEQKITALHLQIEKEAHRQELGAINAQLLQEQQHNAKLVQRYSHTLANTIFPKTLYDIAERIKKNIELKKDALLLQEAYHAEISILLENELLLIRYSTNTPEQFRQAVRQDRLPSTDPEAHNIQDVLNYALSRVTARLLNQNYAKMQKVRDAIITPTGKTLDTIRQDFEEALFLRDPPQTALEWCHNHLRPIELHYASPVWHNIGIQRAKLAEAMLYGHFAEILFNAFKYADHSADWFLRLTCGERVENDISYLTICWENPLPNPPTLNLGSGCGLDAIAEDLRQLNGTTTPDTTLLQTNSAEKFTLTLHYQADLLRLPIKRNIGSILLRNRQPSTT